ncbi:MAG: 30S ribosomal protein S16 [Deltaproteobacteria bacterium]|nr:30S ribosomal protein S16 [Deltaproteobacteria bacterium]RLB00391.1 MAG: 30S ribosomal protein S16 [Deltaproteobacteria bacterium]
MAVSIRLSRRGANKKPFYRVVVADSRFKRDGRFLEIVGYFDPRKRAESVNLKIDRIKYWADKGVKISPAVKKLIKEKGFSI